MIWSGAELAADGSCGRASIGRAVWAIRWLSAPVGAATEGAFVRTVARRALRRHQLTFRAYLFGEAKSWDC